MSGAIVERRLFLQRAKNKNVHISYTVLNMVIRTTDPQSPKKQAQRKWIRYKHSCGQRLEPGHASNQQADVGG